MINFLYIAICDDEAYYRSQIQKLLEQYGKERDFVFQIDEYSSGKELLEKAKKMEESYQIIFMDVDMPDMQGTDVAKALRERKNNVVFCFVTAYEQYAYAAFEVDALDYIIKPIDYDKIKRFMDKALEWQEFQRERQEAAKKYLILPPKQENRQVEQKDILYIEKRRNKCVVTTETDEFICYDTLQNIYTQLNENIFVYTHQGYIVNFYRIKEIQGNVAFLGNGKEIPVSRRHKEELKRRFDEKLERLRRERMTQSATGNEQKNDNYL